MNHARCGVCGRGCREESITKYGGCYKCSAPRKQKIKPDVRDFIWTSYYGNKDEAICVCCQLKVLRTGWHAAHIKAEAKGGDTDYTNLVPVCPTCNLKMRTMDLHSYMKKKGHKDNPDTPFPMDID
jgi:5-methylcytosine-specific restriction endonuclease McrA